MLRLNKKQRVDWKVLFRRSEERTHMLRDYTHKALKMFHFGEIFPVVKIAS